MKPKIDHGGPAFPTDVIIGNVGTRGHPGMTLRQWYAGEALKGILAAEPIRRDDNCDMDIARAIAISFKIAEGMVAEGGKNT